MTMDLIQLHVTGALGALGGIVEMEAYDKIKISGSKFKPEKSTSRWWLIKGPNGMWLIMSSYLSRHEFHEQSSYLNRREWLRLSIDH